MALDSTSGSHVTQTTSAGLSPLTVNLTHAVNALILVFIQANGTISGVTIGGVSANLIATANSGTAAYGLYRSSAATDTISVSWSGPNRCSILAVALINTTTYAPYYGILQTAVANGSGLNAPSVTIGVDSGITGRLVVGFSSALAPFSTGIQFSASQTIIDKIASTTTCAMVDSYAITDSSQTMSYSGPTDGAYDYSTIAFDVLPAGIASATLQDTLTASDSLVTQLRSFLASRSVSDHHELLLFGPPVLSVAVADAITVSGDSAVTIAIRQVTKTDSLTSSDSTARLYKASRAIAEPTLSTADPLLAFLRTANPNITDGLYVSGDTILSIPIRTVALSSSLTTSSSLQLLINRLILDNLSVADFPLTGGGTLVTITDNLVVSSSLIVNRYAFVNLTENTLPLLDILGAVRGTINLSELVPVGDTLQTQGLFNRTAVDTTLSIADMLTRFNLKYTSLTETLAATDSLIRSYYGSRSLTETLPLFDVVGLTKSATITDSLLLSDLILIISASGTVLRVLLTLDNSRQNELFVETVTSDEYEH